MSPKKPPLALASEPLASLKDETLKHLEEMKKELDRSKKSLEAMDELGIDTSLLRSKIEWAEKARRIILQEFGPPKTE